jgi:hypothetical protein
MTSYKPTGSLKSFLEAGKSNTRIISSVERHVLSKPRDELRRTNVLHPSEMVDPSWCYRASYFHLLGEVPAKRNFSFQLLSVFEEGHSIHAKWQGWLEEMGVLYGAWDCHTCGRRVWATSLELDAEAVHGEEHCGPWKYAEVPLDYIPLRIAGHSDGWLKGMGKPLMLEIKSVGAGTLRFEVPELLKENDNDFEKTWKAVKEPFMKHIMQVQVYMKLAELLEYEDVPQEAVLIYESKATQQAKEFVIPKSDFGITQLFDAAQMINDAVDAKTPPACNIAADGCAKCKGYTDVN